MKKLKKLLVIFIIFATMCLFFCNVVKAANTKILNITDERPYTGAIYVVETPNGNDNIIFKIGERSGSSLTYNDALYCLRTGVGFGNSASVNNISELTDTTYTESYNLKTQVNQVVSYYNRNFNFDIDKTNSSYYNAILWIIDNMYLPEDADATNMKTILVNNVLQFDRGDNVTRTQLNDLTNDDIEFVQQMALWYFSNYDENGNTNSLSLADTIKLSNATKIDGNSLDEDKQRAIDALYTYFIESAKANMNNYTPDIITGERTYVAPTRPVINVNSSSKTKKALGNFTVFGPFSISATEEEMYYLDELQVLDGAGTIIPEKDGTTPIIFVSTDASTSAKVYETQLPSIKDAVGQGQFYLTISNRLATSNGYDLTDITINPTYITYEDVYEKYNTTATLWLASEQDTQPVIKIEREKNLKGEFNFVIEKRDEKGNLLFGSSFEMTKEDGSRVIVINNGDGTFNSPSFEIKENGQRFTFELEEISAPTGYIKIDGKIKIEVTTKINSAGTAFEIDNIQFINTTGEPITIDGVTFEVVNNTIKITVVNEKIKEFDLALRKYITKVNGIEVAYSREPNIDTIKLENALKTTAEYKHRKDPITVKTNDSVTYTIAVYNEGEIDGIVTEILDYLPEGLEYDSTLNANLESNYIVEYNTTTRVIKITPRTGGYLFKINAYDSTKTDAEDRLDAKTLEIVCKVTAQKEHKDQKLTNIATMKYAPANANNANLVDRDSRPQGDANDNFNLPNATDWPGYKGNDNNKPNLGDSTYHYEGQEDDDDFEKVIVPGVPYDLSLRKFITKVNGKEVSSREPIVDTSKLNTIDATTGEKITTAKYTHTKEPVTVKKGDIVTYTIRVYNEGEIDGYVTKIADYIPEGLGYIMDYKENTDNFWIPVTDSTTKTINLVGTDGIYANESAIKNLKLSDFNSNRVSSLSDVKIVAGKTKISSSALEYEKIKAYNPELTSADIDSDDNWQQSQNGTDGLYYRDVEITCIVLAENTYKGQLRNIAEIQEDKPVDEDNNPIVVDDRDSTPDDVDTDHYTPPTDNSTYQEDDDDYELIELKYFDLALRKFITAVNNEEITTRIPDLTVNSEGNIEYVHDKTPIYVANSDIVTYTIRVYNEGTVLGYAMEISDDIPDGLEFLPQNETNIKYRWVMLDSNGEETENVSEAVEIRTKYLENSLLRPYDPTQNISDVEPLNPDYAEVKVAFKVVETKMTQSDRIIINKAQITEDKPVDEDGNELDLNDEDSIPDEWNEGEDDQDIEKVYVRKFDLALLKWVTKTILIVDGKTTTTETGFTPYDDPEPIAKVVVDKKKLNKTTVKFVYNIIIFNQGEIAGYATEITDYIPAGLEFYEEDNPIWSKDGEGKITTRALEGKLLQPGESATVEVVFRWKKDANNLGIKTNIAEISEDYNDKGAPDIDSTPDNVKTQDYEQQQEDDDDRALVMLELKTGGFKASYLWLGFIVITIIAGGITLIKKYVI